MTTTKPTTRKRDPQALRALANKLLAYPQRPSASNDAEVIFDLFAVPIGTAADGGPRGYIWPEDNPGWSLGIRYPGRDRAWFDRQPAHTDDNSRAYHPPVIERDNALVQMNDLRILPVTSSIDAALKLLSVVPWLSPVLDYPNRTVRLLNGISLPVGGKDYACEGEIPIALTAAILLAAADQAE